MELVIHEVITLKTRDQHSRLKMRIQVLCDPTPVIGWVVAVVRLDYWHWKWRHTFLERLRTTLPPTQCHMPGDLNRNSTTVRRTSKVTGSGLHLVVCCGVNHAGSTGRRDSSMMTHCLPPLTTSEYPLFHSILLLSSHAFPSHIVPASITCRCLSAYNISSVT